MIDFEKEILKRWAEQSDMCLLYEVLDEHIALMTHLWDSFTDHNLMFCRSVGDGLMIGDILRSCGSTLKSVKACLQLGNIADSYMLVRKYRDDMFFYLYCVYVYDKEAKKHPDRLPKPGKVLEWLDNERDHFSVSGSLKNELFKDPRFKELVEKFNLLGQYESINAFLNSCAHTNGCGFVNFNYDVYARSKDGFKKIYEVMKEILGFMTSTFIAMMTLQNQSSIMSIEYICSFENGMEPEPGSQYWVASIIYDHMHKYASEDMCLYIAAETGMEL